jgi:hypothetical protein
MKNILICSSAFLFLGIVACGGGTSSTTTSGGTSGGGGSFSGSAQTDSPAPPSGSKVVVVWSVSSGSPDYSYAFGSGSVNGAGASFSFASNPPSDALNAGKLGVGLLAVVDSSIGLPEGKLGDTALDNVLALSADYAIIFRASTDTVRKDGWDSAFPQGYACGKCVPSDAGFDSFVAVDCSQIRLVPASSKPRVCNWT